METSRGVPLLQGWAVVDNVSAADWTDVELSLVAGAPQAFRQALSLPLFVARPTVALGNGTALVPETHGAGLVTGTPRVTGVARDASGAALPGVSVELLDGERTVAKGSPTATAVFPSVALPLACTRCRRPCPALRRRDSRPCRSTRVALPSATCR